MSNKNKKHQIEHEGYLAFKRLIEIMPGHVYWLDKSGVYLGCNKKHAEHAGLYRPEEIIGKRNSDLPWKADADKLDNLNKTIMRGGKTETIEEVNLTPKGIREVYLSEKTPIVDDGGNVIGLLGISFDITDRKRVEEELAETKVREAHFKAMSSVGGMMAHELRTPLASIALNASSIKEFFPILVEAYRVYSETTNDNRIRKQHLDSLEEVASDIEQSTLYASNTIKTILTGFHYATSEIAPIEELNINAVIKQAIANYPLHEEEKALIVFEPTKEYKILGVSDIIIHVIHNLLKNALYAIEAANKGNITITLAELEDSSIQMEFQDTAKGIPEEVREHIFEPFYTTKDSETSIGLGLYFCKMALEKMNASISCDSKPDEYANFTIKFSELP